MTVALPSPTKVLYSVLLCFCIEIEKMAYFGLIVGIIFLLYLLIVKDVGVYGVSCKKEDDPIIYYAYIVFVIDFIIYCFLGILGIVE